MHTIRFAPCAWQMNIEARLVLFDFFGKLPFKWLLNDRMQEMCTSVVDPIWPFVIAVQFSPYRTFILVAHTNSGLVETAVVYLQGLSDQLILYKHPDK